MFDMNESLFSEMQQKNCWFTLSFFEDLPEIEASLDDVLQNWSDDKFVQRHLFAMIFGAYGYPFKPRAAEILILNKIEELEKREPKNKSLDNIEFTSWLNLYAQYNVLLGTDYAYRHDYVKAAFCLMNGLKTGCVDLFMPYCDFIRYVLSKVEEMPAELVEYDGCGFSADDPMGGEELNGGMLIPNVAQEVIPALQGIEGGMILAYNGNTNYGNVKRIGSIGSKKFRNQIDIYEVLVVKHLKLKKLRLYFNGYFTRENRNIIRLPKGFEIDSCNPAAKYYIGV